ncbi:M13 family metallopeptidase [Companilactobacillus mishanensis]|uniref:M13 family metallopeptidase n=1 Tax=Companilactobacillus mishanensis TaxID=2486008 RepID=A0ABW9P8N2_9LACO|nr:M13 family metallopeptidase [Companilactobacillus mishanensis]MQS45522.1 M13 family metallopeptidase [Companilactobacillus mishanensis]
MKNRSGILICTTVLTILLGMSAVTENAKADTVATADQSVQTEQTTTTASVKDDTNVVVTDSQQANSTDVPTKNDDALTVPAPDVDQQPGGDWSVDPSTAAPQNNFYYSVNKDWLDQHKNDNDGTDNFSIINDKTEDNYEKDLSDISKGDKTADVATKQAADYYQKYLTTVESKKTNIDSLKKDIQQIDSMKNYSDLNSNMDELIDGNFDTPFAISVTTNLKDNLKNRLAFSAGTTDYTLPFLSLDDDSIAFRSKYYEEMPKLFKMLGYDDVTTKEILDNALTFDDLMFRNEDALSGGQDNNPEVVSISDFENHFNNVNFTDYINKSYPTAKDVEIDDSTFYSHYNNVMSAPNFEKMKDWMLVTNVLDNYYVFGKKGKEAVKDLIADDPSTDTDENDAFENTSNNFQTVMSKYYAGTHVSGETKTRIGSLIDNIISTYKDNIKSNSWLSDDGKSEVLNKLSKITVRIGGPTEIKTVDDYSSLSFPKYESIYDWNKEIQLYRAKIGKQDFDTTNERGIWEMPVYQTNAYYEPADNSINVLAAILQEPFYSENYSDSQLYGSMGAIIGHEISHGFDNNGSNFDANGNYRDTWAAADRAKFDDLTKKLVDEYDGIQFDSLVENGEQTLGENIADNGGVNVALQVAKSLPNFNAKEFFSSWASNWRMISGPITEIKYETNEHSIGPLRANVVVQNIPDFYTAFNVKQGDAMWLDPSKRVRIW